MNAKDEIIDDEFEDDVFEDEEDDVFEDEEDDSSAGDIKYPNVKVQLTGRDGNAFAVMGSVKEALRKAGVSREETDQFLEEAMSGDYNNLLCTCMRWVNVR